MSDYTVLADVGESLRHVLWQEIQTMPPVAQLIGNQNNISLESPFELQQNNNPARISIYLYRIVEDAVTKNQFPVRGNGDRLRRPPLTLDLQYLITPLVGPQREQHIILGMVMKILYDRAILEGDDLQGSLRLAQEPIRVVLNPVTLEETTRVWQALEMSYRLSICYIARVAMVDSDRQFDIRRVIQKNCDYGEKS